jgi:hypothetical protein
MPEEKKMSKSALTNNQVKCVRNAYLITPSTANIPTVGTSANKAVPAWRGERAAGEIIGKLVEIAACYILHQHLPLQEERVLACTLPNRNGAYSQSHRELDAVAKIDDRTLLIYEVKLSKSVNLQRGVGLQQVSDSARLLKSGGCCSRVRKRLVYIARHPLPLYNGLTSVTIDDTTTDTGVIWITPEQIAEAAREMNISLPEGWMSPAVRGRSVASTEDWRRFAVCSMMSALSFHPGKSTLQTIHTA